MAVRLPALPLAWRIFLGTSLVVASTLGGALAWTARSADSAAEVGAARGVAALDAEVAAYLDGDGRALRDGASVFARGAGFRAVLAAGSPEDALDQAREAADQLGAAWVQLVDAGGRRLAKSDEPAAPAAPLGDSPLVRDALEGRPRTAYGIIGDTALAHVVAVPVEGATPGRTVGALMVARPLDPRAARGAGAEPGREVAFYLLPRDGPPRVAAATFGQTPGLAAALGNLPGARDGDGPEAASRAAAGQPSSPRAGRPAPTALALDGTNYLARAHPLRAATGRAVGGYAVLRSSDVELAAFAALRRATLIAGAVGLLAALAISFAIARQVTRPLAALADAARRAAAGDYATTFAARTRRDEVGVVAMAFRTLLDDLQAKQVLVEFARLTRGRGTSGRSRATGERRRATPARASTMTAAEPTLRFPRSTPPTPGSAMPVVEPSPPAVALAGDTPPEDGPAVGGPHGRTPPAFTPANDTPPGGALLGDDDSDLPAVDAVEAAAALRPGEFFAGRYLIEAMIGAGGSGVVFRARDSTRPGEPLALKVLRPDVVQHDPNALARLAREVETTSELEHPNVVRTYGMGESDGIYFLTMEYVEGKSLRELVDERGALPVRGAVEAARQICRALAHAHARGVLHRDVKPHNAVLTPGGILKVMDFGAARFADVPRGVTETGVLVGTPAYMAPEVLRGARGDARADVYAAGVVLYECLTGVTPFAAGGSALVVVTHVLESEPEDPCALRPEVPRALGDLVLAALAKDPAARPASAEAFERALAALS